jgi:branched-chain amino acid transport system permease protein
MSSTDILLQVLWTSIANASYQVLLALAFAFVLKVTKVWNFTQPALMGVAFYLMYVMIVLLDLPVTLAVVLALVPVIVIAVGTERYAFETLRQRKSESITFFIFSLIFAEFVVFLLTLIFTTAPTFMLPDMISPIRLLGGIVISDWDIQALVVMVVTSAAFWLFLNYSRTGQYLIAVSNNPDLAEVYGIDRKRCYELSMAIAAGLIGIATYLAGGKLAFFPEMPIHLMVYAVAATILGGIGNVLAAGLAAVVISVMQQGSVLFIESRWQPLIVFGVLFIAILFFPKGVRWPGRRVSRGPSAVSLGPRKAEA